MKESDFKKYGIVNFTPAEVKATGACLGDVQLRTMIAAQLFRIKIGRRVGLIVNGMTTGDHKAKEHPQGLALDGFLYPDDGPVYAALIFKAALSSGFKGIGIYNNGVQYSFHLDLRAEYAFWGAKKDVQRGIKDWEYVPLLADI